MSQAALVNDVEVPDRRAADEGAEALAQVTAFLHAHPTPALRVQLCSDNPDAEPTRITVPSFVVRFFIDILAQVANGNAITVAPIPAELTTQQAADLLNVSRPYVIKLLEERKIPFRRVGNRRKVLLTDLLDYKRRDDQYRREVLDELTRKAQNLGLEY
jgi:excisionase family DNA binding protein